MAFDNGCGVVTRLCVLLLTIALPAILYLLIAAYKARQTMYDLKKRGLVCLPVEALAPVGTDRIHVPSHYLHITGLLVICLL